MVTVLVAVGTATIFSTATLAFWKKMFWFAAPVVDGFATFFVQETKLIPVTMITKNFFIF